VNNKLRIRPLLKYEVTYGISVNQNDTLITETFTADDHDSMHGGKTVFYRTGNVIREIHVPIIQMTISPVDAEDLTDIQ
jgi:hypothetical protein